jgi:AAA-like domain/CHAT domain
LYKHSKLATKILFLAANPKNTGTLGLTTEIEEIRKELRSSEQRECFELEQRFNVRPENLQQAFYDVHPQIVHFSGHGLGTETGKQSTQGMRDISALPESEAEPEGLVFEDALGQINLVNTKTISDLFECFADEVECVVLNACYSVKQAEAIAQYIPYVIGMNRAVGDTAARVFAVGFYKALGDGRDIEVAFKLACNQIALNKIPEELTPILKRRSEVLRLGKLEALRDVRSEGTHPGITDIPVVEINGYFHIIRPRLERRCYEEVSKPGMLIRIKSPEKMGKSLMMGRVLDYVKQQGYRTAVIDLREANQDLFLDINQFLQWLCAYVSDQLNIDQNPEENWKKFLGANPNCTKYFEKHFLTGEAEPLVLAFDNFDCIFDHSNIETDFCGLLRGWFEKVNTSQVWGNLRQVIVYSQESYATKDINQSPFNVGLPIELGELDASQVLALANAYGLTWTIAETNELMDMVGGHPYLVQLALDPIAHQDIGLDELLRMAPTDEGMYRDYLNERLQSLEKNSLLVEAMKQVVNADSAVRLSSKEAFKLDSMGLIKRLGNNIVPRCNLYRLYFRDRLR